MASKDWKVYMNGEIIPESEAKISIYDIGRLYGAAFYESLRTFKHTYFEFDAHLTRLERSLRYAGFLHEVDMNLVREALTKTLEVNLPRIHPDDDAWICVEVTPGEGFPIPTKKQLNKKPLIFAYGTELPHGDYYSCYQKGKSVITSTYRNIPPQAFEQRCKNRARLAHFLSKAEAQRQDPKSFALMLDTDGFICEGTGANIFFVRDGVLYTPKTRNILVGISRTYVIRLAKENGIPVMEEDLTLYDAYNADEAFWTTSSYCMLPISTIDGRVIGKSLPGPVFSSLISAWGKKAGVDIISQSKKFSGAV